MEQMRSTGQRPFRYNPKHARKMARLRRLQRKGLTPATDKASLRQAADQAIADFRLSEADRDTRIAGK